jgi:metal-responsive CopG/Arc/MetJ family transcriptional regulator
MQKVTVNLDKRLVDQIDQIARQRAVDENRYVARTEIISQALIDYLKKQENQSNASK